MAIFDDHGLARINKVLDAKLPTLFGLAPCELSAQDFFDAAIPKEDMVVLEKAHRLVGGPTKLTITVGRDDADGGITHGRFTLQGCHILQPHYLHATNVENFMPGPAKDAITSFLAGQHEVVREVVALKGCIAYLNIMCSAADQINAYLPALGNFMRGREDDPNNERPVPTFEWDGRGTKPGFTEFNRARRRLVSGKVAKQLPSVPRAIVNECRNANTLLLRCAMAVSAAYESPAVTNGGEPAGVTADVDYDASARLPEVLGGKVSYIDKIPGFTTIMGRRL